MRYVIQSKHTEFYKNYTDNMKGNWNRILKIMQLEFKACIYYLSNIRIRKYIGINYAGFSTTTDEIPSYRERNDYENVGLVVILIIFDIIQCEN